MTEFSVSYHIVTPESAEHGDFAECGMIARRVTLREAIAHISQTRTCHCDGIQSIEPNENTYTHGRNDAFRWIDVVNGPEFVTGAQETRSIHLANTITPASRARILRLIKSELIGLH